MRREDLEANAMSMIGTGLSGALTRVGELGQELLPIANEISRDLALAAIDERPDLLDVLHNQLRTLGEAGRRDISAQGWAILDAVIDAAFFAAMQGLRALTGGPLDLGGQT